MKSVVCMEPDRCELVLSDRQADTFVLDPETYYYFRDQIFIEGIQNYIKQSHPGELPPGKVIDGLYHAPPKSVLGVKQVSITLPAESPAAKVAQWFDTQDVIVKYYKEWRRQEPKFYAHNGRVYSFVFHGFLNVGNEIDLLRWEPEELVAFLDEAYRHPIMWTFKRTFK